MKNLLVFGATSKMIEEMLRIYAREGARLALVARSQAKLDELIQDLKVRGASQVSAYSFDLMKLNEIRDLVLKINQEVGPFDLVLIGHGVLGDQELAHHSFEECKKIIDINFLSPLAICAAMIPIFEAQNFGSLAVFSSVAGDRGRAKTNVYGAAKAGLTSYLSGLRQKWSSTNLKVITIKPGFVHTPMTAHLPNGPLVASPDVVARTIVKAIEAGREVVYVPWFWRLIMLIIIHLPLKIFKKTKF